MPEGDQNRPSTREANHNGMSTLAGIDVQRQLETLIQSFQTGDPPMPVVVLHAEDGDQDGRVARLVDQLRKGRQHHGTRCSVALGRTADADARGAGRGTPSLARAVTVIDGMGTIGAFAKACRLSPKAPRL